MNKGFFKGWGTSPVRHALQRVARVADPVDAQDVETRNHMRGATANPPSYFPASAAGRFDPYVSTYGWTAANLHKIRAALKKAATSGGAGVPLHIVFLGDSTLIGFNGTAGGAPIGYNSDRAIPRQFGLALSNILGGIAYTDGVRQAVVALSAPQGDRTTLTGTFSTQASGDSNLLFSNGVGTAAWKSLDAGTTLEFYWSDLTTTAQCTWSVDGGVQTGTITTTGTSTIKKTTVSGLANTPHTLTITTASGNTWITGWRVFSPGLVQIHCHNLAIGGTRSNSGAAGINWSDVTSTGLQTSTSLMLGSGAANITPDLVIVCVGNNDAFNLPIPAEQIIQGWINMRAMWPTVPFVFIHPPMVPATDASLFDRFSQQIITAIDGMSQAVYFSWDDWDNRSASFVADGLAGADNIHPIDAEAMALGRHLASMVAGPEIYSTPMTVQALIADVTTSGTTEQITYQVPIPSWFWRAGGTIRVVVSGTCTSGSAPTLLAHTRIGILGTTADASTAVTTATPILTAGVGWRYECEITCRTVGATGTVVSRAKIEGDSVLPRFSADTTATTVNTNVYNYLTVTLTPGGTTPVFVQRMAFLDTPPGP